MSLVRVACIGWLYFIPTKKKIKREMMMEEKIISCNFVRLLSLCFKFKATNKRNWVVMIKTKSRFVKDIFKIFSPRRPILVWKFGSVRCRGSPKIWLHLWKPELKSKEQPMLWHRHGLMKHMVCLHYEKHSSAKLSAWIKNLDLKVTNYYKIGINI